MTTKRNRPGVAPKAAPKVIAATTASVTQIRRLPRVRAFAGPPAPGRRLWLIFVPACPWCTAPHHHRYADSVPLLRGKVDRACPTTGCFYVLGPVRRLREPRRTGRRP